MRPLHNDQVELEVQQVGGKGREPIILPLVPSVLDHDVAAYNIAKLAQTLPERIHGRMVLVAEVSDPVHLPRLLRFSDKRQGDSTDEPN